MGKLTNKVAVVTGGTTGIGLAVARRLAAEGAEVTITGTNAKTLAAARAELGDAVHVVASDATSAADIDSLARSFEAKGKPVDVLVLNAGVAKFAPILAMDEATFDESYRVNVRGPWLAIKRFARLLPRGGAIVLTGSINADLGMPGSVAYAGSKAAARSLVRVAAAELAEAGVRVNSVSPGPIDTPLYDKLGIPPEAREAFAADLTKRVPMHRFGTPDEVAKSVLFLASDDASFMTGEDIVLDGGMTRV